MVLEVELGVSSWNEKDKAVVLIAGAADLVRPRENGLVSEDNLLGVVLPEA